MPTNLRARPIEGYITDNAGNILRNVDVIIKEDTPNSTNVIDVVQSDDDGYFVSKPIKNGIYDVYESGVRVYRLYHSSDPTQISSFQAGTDNIPLDLFAFSTCTGSAVPANDINFYRQYVQIEPETLDVAVYGHMFPLWNIDPASASAMADHKFEHMPLVHTSIATSNSSRLTHSRFDAEYFYPLYAQNSTHRRIRWAGVPGIQMYNQSKIVLPLDYFSIVPNHHYYQNISPTISSVLYAGDTSNNTLELTITGAEPYDAVSNGDIVKLSITGSGGGASGTVYGIVIYKASGVVYVKRWASDYASNPSDFSLYTAGSVNRYTVYQGMFVGIESLSQSTGERFYVQENLSAQNATEEIYSYEGAV